MGLRQNIPAFVADIPQMADLMDAEQPEVERIEQKADDMLEEFFTATFTEETARYWEEFLGFSYAPDWELERRRERVRSRLISQRRMTRAVFQEVVESMAMTEVELYEDADNSTVTIKFVGIYGVTPYLEDVMAEVEQIRPYHLKILYEWVFVRHSQLGAMTHGALGEYTNEMIRNGEVLEEE